MFVFRLRLEALEVEVEVNRDQKMLEFIDLGCQLI